MKANIPFSKHRIHSNVNLRLFSDSIDFKKLISQCKDNGNCPISEVIQYGGAGSGHHGHEGTPGSVGGSKGGGGGKSSGKSDSASSASRDSGDTKNDKIRITGIPSTPVFFPASPQEKSAVKKMIRRGEVESDDSSVRQAVEGLRAIRKQIIDVPDTSFPAFLPGKPTLGDTLTNNDAATISGKIKSGEIDFDTESRVNALKKLRSDEEERKAKAEAASKAIGSGFKSLKAIERGKAANKARREGIETDVKDFPGEDLGPFAVGDSLVDGNITEQEMASIASMIRRRDIGLGDGSVADAIREMRAAAVEEKAPVSLEQRLFDLGASANLKDVEAKFLLGMINRGQIAPGKASLGNALEILRKTVQGLIDSKGIGNTAKEREKFINMLNRRNLPPSGRLGFEENTEEVYKLAEHCTVTQNNGCPLLMSSFAENTNNDLGWQEIFEFEDSNVLNVILSNFKKLKDKLLPPLKLGHDESQKLVQNSGFPSAGWVTDLKRKPLTNKLLAYLSNVPKPIIKLIESGAYKRISAEIYNNYVDPDTNEAFGPAMRAVSILGADVPRIKTLKDLAIIYHSDGLPFKTFQKEDVQMETIMAMLEQLKEEIKRFAGLGRDTDEEKEAVEAAATALQEKFNDTLVDFTALAEKQTKEHEKMLKDRKKKVLVVDDKDSIKLAETVASQTSLITQLSESVKVIGSELKDAKDHILESKKAAFKSTISKNFTPALVDRAMELVNFSEEDKVADMLTHIQKLQENDALFLDKPLEIEQEEFEKSFGPGNSQDKLHNDVTSLAEKEKITYKEAFDKVMILKQVK